MTSKNFFIHCFIRFLLTLCLGLGAMASSQAAPEYRVTVVGPPDSRANGINNAGVVVGTYPANATSTRGFLSRGHGWVDLPAIGTSSGAVAINDRGQILGNWRTAGGQGRGVIWFRGDRRDIGVVPGASATRYTGINNAGYTIAQANRDDGQLAFLRTPGGAFRNLGSLGTIDPITEAHAINNRNQISGASGEFSLPEIPFHAYIWTHGVLRDLGNYGLTPNEANDINDRGQATGYLAVPNGGAHARVAFIYTRGRLQDIDGRPSTVDRYSQGQGINNRGHAVGDSDFLRGWVYRGRRMQSLNALIDPASGWDIQLPRDINDAGQIAATAVRNGQYYAVRLDPIRPYLDAAPELDADEADADAPLLSTPLSAEEAANEARLDAQAQAREVVHPVQQ